MEWGTSSWKVIEKKKTLMLGQHNFIDSTKWGVVTFTGWYPTR
jgi:hypothetical protein